MQEELIQNTTTDLAHLMIQANEIGVDLTNELKTIRDLSDKVRKNIIRKTVIRNTILQKDPTPISSFITEGN